MSRSKEIVELARKQYTESNPQSMWMASQSNFDDQLENLENDVTLNGASSARLKLIIHFFSIPDEDRNLKTS
ncbi:hypothetical protein FQA39_LY09089 [Lamprigera yunnana]|nr:hypothetical protein FQA39_LY09089 [Lamprigera yunnana]